MATVNAGDTSVDVYADGIPDRMKAYVGLPVSSISNASTVINSGRFYLSTP